MAKKTQPVSVPADKPVVWDKASGMPDRIEFGVGSSDFKITLTGPEEAMPWQHLPLVQLLGSAALSAMKRLPSVSVEGTYLLFFQPRGVPELSPQLLNSLKDELVSRAMTIVQGRDSGAVARASATNDEEVGVTCLIMFSAHIDSGNRPHSYSDTLEHPLEEKLEKQTRSLLEDIPNDLDQATIRLQIIYQSLIIKTILIVEPRLNSYLWDHLPKSPAEKRERVEKVNSILSEFQLSIIRGKRRCRLAFAANRWNVQGRFLLIPIGESKPIVTRAELADILPFHLASAI